LKIKDLLDFRVEKKWITGDHLQIASGTAFITFTIVKVPENLIGKESQGFKYIMFNYERLTIIIQALCSARICNEEAFKYAKQR
jgi:alkylation response protein AidB-like acyl-CoA dehydrogenase